MLAVLLAGCGGDDEEPTPTSPGGSGEPTATVTEPGGPGEPTATAGEEQPALDGTKWLLAAINGADVDLQEPITLSFDDGQAGGFSGCNEYGGAYTAGPDGSFAMPEIAQTDMACETGMDLEAEYLSALGEASRYTVAEETRLELANSAGETTLVFSRDERQALDGTAWTLLSIDGNEDAPDGTAIIEIEITLELRAGQVSGSSGCNTFGGMYSANAEGAFTVSELFWTEMGCLDPPGIMELEQQYLDELANVAAYEHDIPNNRLLLFDGEGRTRLIFANQEELPGTALLDETGWIATEMNGQEIDPSPVITIMFVASQFAGKLGCLSYDGAIQTAPDGEISELRAFGGYDGACGDQETPPLPVDDYFATLEAAARYRLSSDRLELIDASGETVLTFRHGIPDGGELAGTAWELRSLDGEDVIEETAITLELNEVWLGGNSGCNGYGAQYMLVEPGAISIAGIASEAQLCNEPAGVMDQEAAYQHTLQQIVSYQLTDTELQLLDTEGVLRLVLEPAQSRE
jgi:heat shock protein HslJ